jgi:hypothetical protein
VQVATASNLVSPMSWAAHSKQCAFIFFTLDLSSLTPGLRLHTFVVHFACAVPVQNRHSNWITCAAVNTPEGFIPAYRFAAPRGVVPKIGQYHFPKI